MGNYVYEVLGESTMAPCDITADDTRTDLASRPEESPHRQFPVHGLSPSCSWILLSARQLETGVVAQIISHPIALATCPADHNTQFIKKETLTILTT